MNSNNMRSVLVGLLVIVALLIGVLQEIRVRRLKAEAEHLRTQVTQANARWGEAKMPSLPEAGNAANFHATDEGRPGQGVRSEGLSRGGGLAQSNVATTLPGGAVSEIGVNAAAGTNESGQAFSGLMRGAMEQQVMGQLERMKTRLKLTPDQETAIRAILQTQVDTQAAAAQKMFAGKMTQEEMMSLQKSAVNPEEQIKALLNPDQLSEYQELKKEESVSNARLVANSEVLQMQNILGLSQEQQDQVYEALYQQTLDAISGNLVKSLPKGADAGAIVQMQLDQKVKALEGILTPEQVQKYRQMQEKQLEMIKNLMPMKSTPAVPAAPGN